MGKGAFALSDNDARQRMTAPVVRIPIQRSALKPSLILALALSAKVHTSLQRTGHERHSHIDLHNSAACRWRAGRTEEHLTHCKTARLRRTCPVQRNMPAHQNSPAIPTRAAL